METAPLGRFVRRLCAVGGKSADYLYKEWKFLTVLNDLNLAENAIKFCGKVCFHAKCNS